MTGGGSSGDWLLSVPEPFAAGIATHAGDSGLAWLASLPALVDDLLGEWALTPDGPVMHGFLGIVVPARRGPERYVLKVSQPSAEVDNQAAALLAWHGRGMVEVHTVDPARGALLLERLDERRSLDDVELHEAIGVAGLLLRRLAVPAGGAPLPTLRDHVAGWPQRWAAAWDELGRPLPPRLLAAAGEACAHWAPTCGTTLVDHDLHYRNVMAGEREPWLAVDPRGVVGDAEFALAPLLWNRFLGAEDVPERFARLVDLAGFDRDRARGWTLVQVVDYFLWSTRAGLTWDPAACRVIADWLVDAPAGGSR